MKVIKRIRCTEIEQELEENDENSELIEKYKKERLVALLTKANIGGDNDEQMIAIYEDALKYSEFGWTLYHARDVDEIYVNNYNNEWISCWNANMDIQICLDFFAIITYISDYFTKDDSGTLQHIKEALKQAGNDTLKSKLSVVAHTFLTHR